MPRSSLKIPKFLAGARIKCEEVSFRIARKHQITGCSEYRGQQSIFIRNAPDSFSCQRIKGVDVRERIASGRQSPRSAATGKEDALARFLTIRCNFATGFD